MVNETESEKKHLFKLAQKISDRSWGQKEGVEEATDELIELIVANNLSTTLILARLCQEYGTLRAAMIRIEIRRAIKRRAERPNIVAWADEFKGSPSSGY